MSPGLVILFLALLLGIQPITTDLYLPALPTLTEGFGASMPQAAGAASALNGFVMMLAAFAMGGWLGRHMDGTVFPLAYGLWFWRVLVTLSAWTLVQKYGEPARH